MEFTIKLVRLFDAIIELIASCFGFLPPWSIALACSGGALVIGVVVYKFMRG